MAKKKAPVRSPDQWSRKPLALQVRGSAEWKGWVEELAGYDRTTAADLVDRALTRYAREIGYGKEPPER